jgi:hypothetical protein
MLLHCVGFYTHTRVPGEPAALLFVPNLHGVTFQQIIIVTFTAMRTLNFPLCAPSLVFLSSCHYSILPEYILF